VSFGEADLLRLLLAAVLLLLAAQGLGALFARHRQPRVIGEILGGLLLGPTVFGTIAPSLQAQLLPTSGPAASALAALYQLGLIWLMFAAGSELRGLPSGPEKRAAIFVALVGMAVPFAAGLAVFEALQPSWLGGPAGDTAALGLVFTAALAVTSIPVISRIMMDLGLLSTPFARIVLGAALIEDIVLFGVLGVAVGLTQDSAQGAGLTSLLGIESASPAGAVFYAATVVLSLGAAALLSRWRDRPGSLLGRALYEPAGMVLLLLTTVAAAMAAGAPPLFRGLVAGLVAGGRSETAERVRTIGASFLVPIYFALVGLRLELDVLEPVFFAAFFLFACAIKAGGVYLGARAARVTPTRARDLAVAMNARGGPGIILASVALDAGIIDSGFYASLVLLAVLSSLLAGWWLERNRSRGAARAPQPAPPRPLRSRQPVGTAAHPRKP
jgi:Kef-type K+ transport system membrane component KefB